MMSLRLTVLQLRKRLSQLSPQLAPGASICPTSIVVRAALVESRHLLDLNQVDAEAMRQDTGLDYSAANAMLWRRHRATPVCARPQLACNQLFAPYQMRTLFSGYGCPCLPPHRTTLQRLLLVCQCSFVACLCRIVYVLIQAVAQGFCVSHRWTGLTTNP